MLIDPYHRKIDYLRVSVTDRCNLRCIYCMPLEGIDNKMSFREILSYEELLRIIRIAVSHGVTKVRVTGGEPLIRKGIVGFIDELNKIKGIKDLSLTTNGVLLKGFARDLVEAGLKRINVSLDSLNPTKYEKITRGDHIYRVFEGLEEAEKVGLSPIKVNVVIIKNLNDDEVIDFALITKRKPYHIRFIEYMPFNAQETWERGKCISTSQIMAAINRFQGLLPVEEEGRHTGPARRYRFEDGVGELGFISPISDHFCSSCNRLRLTADGKLRTCLFSDEEVDIKSFLRKGCSDKELEKLLFSAVKSKPEKHLIEENPFKKCSRSMTLIGG